MYRYSHRSKCHFGCCCEAKYAHFLSHTFIQRHTRCTCTWLYCKTMTMLTQQAAPELSVLRSHTINTAAADYTETYGMCATGKHLLHKFPSKFYSRAFLWLSWLNESCCLIAHIACVCGHAAAAATCWWKCSKVTSEGWKVPNQFNNLSLEMYFPKNQQFAYQKSPK